MYKRIIALCLVLAFSSGCLFSLSKLAVKAGTTAIQIESIDIIDEGEEAANYDAEDFFRVDENYNRKE